MGIMAAISRDPALEDALQSLLPNWPSLSQTEKIKTFENLPRNIAEELFLDLPTADQAVLLLHQPTTDRRTWMRILPPDDAADLIQMLPTEERSAHLDLLDEATRREVLALMWYAEDVAGGLMNPRFIRLRPEVPVEVGLRYTRMQLSQPVEFVDFVYVLDNDQRLIGVVTLRDLLLAEPDKMVSDIMATNLMWIPENMEQDDISQKFAMSGLKAIPVCDVNGKMRGIITSDDIIDVVREEAASDIQKLGGSEALDEPYFQIPFFKMIKKRAGWLVILFLGEMLTATAMGHFEAEIAKAVVLALFIPLIISSGGNSGSQATSIIIRSLALNEVRLKDWARVVSKELLSGLFLGSILGAIGMVRIFLWPSRNTTYGEHFVLIAMTVGVSLIGVVLWGTLIGSTLPLILRRLGFDPAAASAPFVATLVDVTGIVIYFTVASIFLGGVLL
jgi:magnesium transporter